MAVYDNIMANSICVLFLCSAFGFAFSGLPIKCGPARICDCYKQEAASWMMDCKNRSLSNMHQICESITKENETTIVGLDVSLNKLTNINRSSLDGCERISYLNLSGNSINDVQDDTFDEMANLVWLDLSNNSLHILYDDVKSHFLVNLNNLKILYIHKNFWKHSGYTHTYPRLSNLTSLESVTMDGLYNTSFSEDYRSLHSLISLNMSGNVGTCHIRYLNSNTFGNIPSLQILDLSNCSLFNIDAETFKPLRRLTWLDLSSNLELGFKVLRNVSYGLQFTQIDFLNYSKTHNTFGQGTTLKLQDVCFLHNTTLRVFSISSNRIEIFETNLFILLPATLKEIYVESNRFYFYLYLLQLGCLSNVSKVFVSHKLGGNIPALYTYDIHNTADLIIPMLEECPFMSEIYLRNISKKNENCHYFNTTNVDINRIHEYQIPKNITEIIASGCHIHSKITQFPIVPFMNKIEHIDVSRNLLPSWIGPVGPFPALKRLNLSRNYCTYIGQDFFLFADSLELLDISNNFIGIQLESYQNVSVLRPLINLRRLYANGNQIKHIPVNTFRYLVNLEVLDLSYNTIDEFDIAIEHLPNLTHLNLSNNALQALPEKLIRHFEDLYEKRDILFSINLQNNPIKMSCNTKHFLKWLIKRKQQFVNFDEYIFEDDHGNHISKSEFVSKVSKLEKLCRSYTALIVAGTLSLSVFLSIILGGIIYKNRWKLRYLLYMNKRRFYGYQRLADGDNVDNYKYDAFISYSEEDIGFVIREIIPKLEEGDEGLSLCIHQRNFLPGNTVADNIIEAIECSRKTVVLLSKSFIKRKWCLYEFNMARMESIYSREDGVCLIVVMLETVPTKEMPLEMLRWIKNNSYIEFSRNNEGYDLFWRNLRDAIFKRHGME